MPILTYIYKFSTHLSKMYCINFCFDIWYLVPSTFVLESHYDNNHVFLLLIKLFINIFSNIWSSHKIDKAYNSKL